ncbi:3-hydroxybutyrate dehydrogenase [Marinobacter sp. 71-i]|uniref:3-hydroxybutyrate dehydrogenase n=1 Tax=Marinobacter iranensis TaxID=2962607 RepID=A0ABT5Y7N3_9GAMM|nr:3-hydroxybutyrate dehydrogenase [Marinobacter iranensis]MDF0749577.1 3-hydroxybutyrate dehydrogenase [Marinobacter iranensis]
MTLKGKCALVTGSNSGLGYAVADSLAAAGANIVLHGLCLDEEGERTAHQLAETHGLDAIYVRADLRHVSEIEKMVATIKDRFGSIDILVNNAVMRHFSPIEEFTAEDWNDSIAVNLSAAFHLSRLSIPGMKAGNWGRIIHMASIYSERGAENRVDYVTTKTGLLGMTRAMAVELAQTAITCNAVCPGTVATPAINERIREIARDKGVAVAESEQEYLATRNPTGRFVAAEGVGALIAFLCSPQAADITGASLPIDGGWLAK